MNKRFGIPMSSKIALQLLIFLMCAVFVFACGSDNDDTPESSGPGVTLADLVGIYELTGFSQRSEDGTVTDEDFQTWWGDMRIADDSTLTLNLTVDQEAVYDDRRLTIVDVENDALLLRFRDGCEQYVDMNRNGDNLILTAPEGNCMENTLVLEFRRKNGGTAEDDDSATAEDEDSATADPEPTPGDVTLADLVGTYEMTYFSVVDGDRTATANDAQTWWGDMRIAADGTLTLNMTINQTSIFDDEELTIVDVENDALLVRSADGDEQYVDMNRDGDNITLIFEGSDAEGTYSLVLEFRKTGSAAEDEDSATVDPGPTPGDVTLADLVGTYELNDFSMSSEGETYEDEDFQTWSGEAEISANSIFTLNMVANQTTIFDDFQVRIAEVENDALLITDDTCRQYIDMTRNGDNMTLVFPEGDCMGDISMVLGMRRTRNRVASLLYNALDSGSDLQLGNVKEAFEKIADSFDID